MRPRMRREDRRVVAVLGFLHGVVHANILSIPVFLLAWKLEFGADDVTLGLLAAAGFGFYGLGAVPFGFLADRRPAGGLLLLCAAGIAISMVGVGASPSIPVLALSLGALGLFSGIYHPRDCRSSRASSRSRAEEWAGTAWAGASGLPRARRSSGPCWRSVGPGGPWPPSWSSRVWSRSSCSSSHDSPSSGPPRPSAPAALHGPYGVAHLRSSSSSTCSRVSPIKAGSRSSRVSWGTNSSRWRSPSVQSERS